MRILCSRSNRLVRLFQSCGRNEFIELGKSFCDSFDLVICGNIITRYHLLKFTLRITTCIVKFCMSLVAVELAQIFVNNNISTFECLFRRDIFSYTSRYRPPVLIIIFFIKSILYAKECYLKSFE